MAQDIPDVIPDSAFTPDAAPAVAGRAPAAATVPDVIPDHEFVSDDDKNDEIGENLKGAAEGAASALSFGLSTGLEKKILGVKDEDINRRRDTIGHTVGTGLALAAPLLTGNPIGALSLASDIGKGAEVASEALGAGKVLKGAVNEAAQMALFQGGDETSKMISNAEESVPNALAHVGFAALGGGLLGGGLGLAGKAISSGAEKLKLNDFVADFKEGIAHAVHNPDPVGGVTKELGDYYSATNSVANEVYGATGLKAQEIRKLAPEVAPKMFTQAQEILAKTEQVVKRLGDDPLAKNLVEEAQKYQAAITKPGASGAEIFEAGNDFKKQVGEWAKYNKDFHPLGERAFRNGAKDVASTLKEALEDSKIWGQAGERQASINKAFSEYLPALKDFRSRFMTKVGGDYTIDPGKINTYITGLGKARTEIKQEMLENFLKASEKYRTTIADTHANLGLSQPFESTPMVLSKRTLADLPAGAKLAQSLVEKGLGKIAGGAIGGAAGNAIGHPFIGAYLGEKTLGKYINSVLPSLIKPISESSASGAGMLAASRFGMAAMQGAKALGHASDAIFRPATSAAIAAMDSSSQDIERVKKWVDHASNNPEILTKLADSDVGHYLPGHQVGIAQKAAQVQNYLAAAKPQPFQHGMLGKTIEPSKAEEAMYDRTVGIAQQPLSLLSHIKSGTLTIRDMQDLKTMHPDMYQAMSQSVLKSLSDAASKEVVVPYKTRQALTLFLGHPVDPTLEQPSIAAAQMAHMSAPKQDAAQQPQGSAPKGSPKALGGLPEMYRTPGQSREQRRNQN